MKKNIIIPFLGILMSVIAIITPLHSAQAVDNRCFYNPFYALTHRNECGTTTENPYCKNPEDCGIQVGIEQTGQEVKGISTSTDAKALIFGWLNFILSFVFIFAVIAIVYAGILYVISIGNDAQKGKANKIIIWVIMGLIIIMLAYALVTTIIRVAQ